MKHSYWSLVLCLALAGLAIAWHSSTNTFDFWSKYLSLSAGMAIGCLFTFTTLRFIRWIAGAR